MKQYWTVPPEWSGETAFLLGCGPSLQGVDLRSLRGRRVIAINDAYLCAPWAEVLYFCDQEWWERNREQVLATFRGRIVVTGQRGGPVPGVRTLRLTEATGLETDPGALRHGSNSGYQCINLAYHFGAARIILLGYDMKVNGNQLHWNPRNGDHRTAAGFQRTLQNVMLPKFATLVQPLAASGVSVVNCTPGSQLTCWPMGSLDKELRA